MTPTPLEIPRGETPTILPQAVADAVPAVASAAEALAAAHAHAAGLLSHDAGVALVALLNDRQRTDETAVDAQHRAERALAWAVLAARRHAWRADDDPLPTPGESTVASPADTPQASNEGETTVG